MKSSDASDAREEAEDRVINEALDDALAVYGHLLSAEEQAEAREFLSLVLATHPATAELIAQLIPAPELQKSDKVSTGQEDAGAGEGGARGASG
jgi:hypothetical protein